jgi:hypothetical protein
MSCFGAGLARFVGARLTTAFLAAVLATGFFAVTI